MEAGAPTPIRADWPAVAMTFTAIPPPIWIWSPISHVNSEWVGMVISHMACVECSFFYYR